MLYCCYIIGILLSGKTAGESDDILPSLIVVEKSLISFNKIKFSLRLGNMA